MTVRLVSKLYLICGESVLWSFWQLCQPDAGAGPLILQAETACGGPCELFSVHGDVVRDTGSPRQVLSICELEPTIANSRQGIKGRFATAICRAELCLPPRANAEHRKRQCQQHVPHRLTRSL